MCLFYGVAGFFELALARIPLEMLHSGADSMGEADGQGTMWRSGRHSGTHWRQVSAHFVVNLPLFCATWCVSRCAFVSGQTLDFWWGEMDSWLSRPWFAIKRSESESWFGRDVPVMYHAVMYQCVMYQWCSLPVMYQCATDFIKILQRVSWRTKSFIIRVRQTYAGSTGQRLVRAHTWKVYAANQAAVVDRCKMHFVL